MPEHGQLKVFMPSLIGDGRGGLSTGAVVPPFSPLDQAVQRDGPNRSHPHPSSALEESGKKEGTNGISCLA